MNLISFVLSEDDLNNVCEIYNRERLSATRTLSNWSSSKSDTSYEFSYHKFTGD